MSPGAHGRFWPGRQDRGALRAPLPRPRQRLYLICWCIARPETLTLVAAPSDRTISARMSVIRTLNRHITPAFEMSDSTRAERVIETLKLAEREPAQEALLKLNELVGLVQGDHEARLEVEEARSSAFLAICEVGKALHRGQPADSLWTAAIHAAERWKALAR